MKAKPLDRLLTILLGIDLMLALWWLMTNFPVQSQHAVNVF